MDSIVIQKVLVIDVIKLQEIARNTFKETFLESNSEDDMQTYLEEELSIDKLMLQLQNQNSEFYFAWLNSRLVGYLKVNFGLAQTELKDKNSLEIERIYVINECHGKQVGQSLYNKALQIATQNNLHYLWLGVWEKNNRAINFYKKNGFVEFDKHIFKLGNDEQTDIMMKLALN
jgi:ribosomal protein S18 acetylase RimI-like enzyme